MNICCIGAGHVGGATMAIVALKCPDITVNVVDLDKTRIAAWENGKLPLYEGGLEAVVKTTLSRNLTFSTDVSAGIKNADIIFIAVNTPTRTYGLGAGRTVNLRFIEDAARAICEHAEHDTIVVEKSTVSVRTADTIATILASNSKGLKFQVLSNPEFLSEGSAVNDLMNPDRVLIGGEHSDDGQRAVETLAGIYARWVPTERIIKSNTWSSELAKLVANAFLAQRVSSINSISALCDVTGADIDEVAHAIGMDGRIGSKFLKASVGFGGASLRKDVLHLAYLCESFGLHDVAAYWTQVVTINEAQNHRFSRRIVSRLFNTVAGKKIAVLGFAFKKNTNDIRESAAIEVCRQLLQERAVLSIYDPHVPADLIQQVLTGDEPRVAVSIASDAYEACRDAHAIAIMTEWDEFKTLDFTRIFVEMKKPAFVFDGRNFLDLDSIRKIGFRVEGIGKPA